MEEEIIRFCKSLPSAYLQKPSQETVWAITLMFYSTKGPKESTKEGKEAMPICAPLFKVLGSEGIRIFRGIFRENSKELRDKFFSHQLIEELWPTISKNLSYDHCFGRAPPNPEIMKSYHRITKIMAEDYGLPLPKWWTDKFPSQ